MSSIGPQLPPQLKRSRDETDDELTTGSNKHARREGSGRNQDEIELNDSGSDSEDDYAPPRPASLPAGAIARAVGPSLPPHLAANNTDEINLSDSDSDSDTGPAPPPGANPNPNANTNPDSDSSDDDDDFGPSLPSASAPRRQIGPSLPPSLDDGAPKRDDWMLAPPPSSSTFSERDTTKIRARKFASKPKPTSSTAPGAPSIWTETPEEKLRRLQDSVLGRTSSASDGPSSLSEEQQRKTRRDEALAAEIHAQRGKTLLEEHQGGKKAAGGKPDEEEDDPSKRAFDREKDMAVGGRITSTQRRELINKSANFGGRFQKGSFL
ncbi:uncharacterized protein TRIVIDRAFT_54782 [Trichoderma virens Gv29-8]|uniref:DUF3752 domain-containing protein n=1 Tax=Hypocrea virens (strain Gv29-8 / FGSC 10586) TaxID=413071 RepID=G9MIH0_HYPVG|nr:uncharacterized protein TRIVIDRAFT_54782 [Trichoderma virens Gv29-8]EHK25287.1 hypothetical protein TRIVIDRAFT_54782 [Trichoderma virens Gv29-8]UKZ48889.1 hypothetical protein TrVGV298_003125 [Trichoderma virens]